MTQDERNELIENHCHIGTDNPAVYCGTYGKYNNGDLTGWWLDLTTFADYDEFIEVCTELHDDEEDPELMFQDYENFPEAWYCESLMDEETFDKIIEYSELDEDEQDAYCEFLNEIDADGDIDTMKDRYIGKFSSEKDFAEWYVDECCEHLTQGMGWLSSYIDYEAVWYGSLRYDYTMTKNGYVFHD